MGPAPSQVELKYVYALSSGGITEICAQLIGQVCRAEICAHGSERAQICAH